MGQMWGTKETSMTSVTSNLQLSSCMKRKQKKFKKENHSHPCESKFKRISESHAQIIIRPPVAPRTPPRWHGESTKHFRTNDLSPLGQLSPMIPSRSCPYFPPLPIHFFQGRRPCPKYIKQIPPHLTFSFSLLLLYYSSPSFFLSFHPLILHILTDLAPFT